MNSSKTENIALQKLNRISWSYYSQIRAMKTIIHEVFLINREKRENTKKTTLKTKKEELIQRLVKKAQSGSLSWLELHLLYDALRESGKLTTINDLPLPEDIKNGLKKIYEEQLFMEESFELKLNRTISLMSKIISPIVELYKHYKERTEQEKKRIILGSMLVQSIVLWESLLKDYLRILLYYDPRPLYGLKENKIFSILEIIRAEDEYPDVRSMVIERYIDDVFFRKNIDEINRELSRRGIIKLEEFQRWEDLREAYYHRNIYVHNNGKINKIYCEKIGLKDCPLGKDIELTVEYINNLLDVLNEFLVFIYEHNYVVRKLKRNNQEGESNG